jgi:uncharacterized protein (DUF885 family)
MTDPRTPTEIDKIAERYLDAAAAHDPIRATYIGLPGHDGELPANDPDWLAQRSALRQATLRELDSAAPVDANDRVTLAALSDELTVEEQLRELGEEESLLNNIASPLQAVRDTFDLMSTRTEDEWAVGAQRLGAVPASIDGYIASLRYAAQHGHVAAQRQVEIAIKQCGGNVGPDGFFGSWARGAATEDGTPLPDALRGELARNAERAGDAYARLESFLRDELIAQAPERDAFGRERYVPYSRAFLGASVDLEETYAWGQEELAHIVEEMQRTAERISPGASIATVIDLLDKDPSRLLDGVDALQAWMQQKSDAAIVALSGTHFDIPEPIRTLECHIAPTQTGGIYYTGPSDDLVTRPGRMWWSVPTGVTTFGTWKELTTVYHEGVPGHHLQIAQTVYRRDLLNRWRRLGVWNSGYGEGWALYAEQLMAELGYLDDPADHLGLLDSQSLRAARVVLDIGVHCGFDAPASVGGGEWTYEKAWEFLSTHCHSAEDVRRFELDRYLGWPGQAPAYKVGQRLWLQLRDEVRAREGDAFDLSAFHRRALDLGAVGLDVLRQALLGELG